MDEKKKNLKLRLTLDIATVDPWLDRPIRKCCSPRVEEPVAVSSAGSHVSSAEMSDRSGGDHIHANEAEKQVGNIILKGI
ncbi:hypothetical protein ABVT39_012645 [Epinephelus coioides]